MLRISYARTLETPFNENLVLSSQGCGSRCARTPARCTPASQQPCQPGFRNEFHAGLQQALGKNSSSSGEYIWKYTHNAFDFSVLGNTPITFPIDWHNSKIPGFALHADVPSFHNFSAYVVMSSVAARFFPPQVAGAGATVGQQRAIPSASITTRSSTRPRTCSTRFRRQLVNGLWSGFNWRYDSASSPARLLAMASPIPTASARWNLHHHCRQRQGST